MNFNILDRGVIIIGDLRGQDTSQLALFHWTHVADQAKWDPPSDYTGQEALLFGMSCSPINALRWHHWWVKNCHHVPLYLKYDHIMRLYSWSRGPMGPWSQVEIPEPMET